MALVVITGGARSGKSAVAALLAEQRGGDVCVVAFGEAGDPEMEERIARHRAERPAHWTTLEPAADELPMDDVPEGALLLLDCLGTLAARIMESEWADRGADTAYGEADTVPPAYAAAVEGRMDAVVESLRLRGGDTLVVTNEVGDGVVPPFALGRLFRDVLGRANRRLMGAADAGWLVVAGRCMELTTLPGAVRWRHD